MPRSPEQQAARGRRYAPKTEKVRKNQTVAAVYDRRVFRIMAFGAHRAPLQPAKPIFCTF